MCIFALVIVLFYSMQKYAVITKDTVRIEMGLASDTGSTVTDTGVQVYEQVNANVSVANTDYSSVSATAGNGLSQMRAIFVSGQNMTMDKIEAYVSRLSTGNALVLEMKSRSGMLQWHTNSAVAATYGLNYDTDTTKNIQKYVDYIKAHDVWLVAQISCCIDSRFASNSSSISIKNATGGTYTNETGTWLDPYNTILRDYIVDLCNELYDMGFDEVVLADVWHPSLAENETVYYTREMSTQASPEGAVCGFAYTVAERLKDRTGVLSIYGYTAYSLVKTDSSTGQNCPFFLKLYDRLYYVTDKYTYSFNLQDIEPRTTIGKPAERFVPVVENYLPNDAKNISWVLIDVEE